ncbi:hypothetical protein [Cupriavidus pauculus]|uniref:hypothetical protein n=1 Tax=Cupriavidus pauculus TaxID=82633 RepID=UPI001D0C3503|nr:hypothetical protein [Cupriavidus pauculus]
MDDNALSAVDGTTLSALSLPAGVAIGSVFTWKDRPYVVTEILRGHDSTRLVVRPAEFSEVLDDLTVQGDLDMTSIDASRIGIVVSNDSSASLSTTNDLRQPTTVRYVIGPCTANVGSTPGEASDATCLVSVDYSDFRFTLNVGIRNALFSKTKVSATASNLGYEAMSVTPFVRATASLLTDKKQPVSLAKDNIPVVYLQIPFYSTLGFLRIDMPVRLDVALPIFKFEAGSEVTFPYSNGVWSMTASIDTPVASIATDTLFKYESVGHIYGVVGADLVLGRLPVLKPAAYTFEANSPDRLLSMGAFFKGGWEGTLSAEVADLNARPCFRWALQGKGGVASDVRVLNNPIEALSRVAMQPFGIPVAGQSGCDEGATPEVTITKATCVKGTNGANNYLVVELEGTASGPEGSQVLGANFEIGSNRPIFQYQSLTCSTWDHADTSMLNDPSVCQRKPGQPLTTAWSIQKQRIDAIDANQNTVTFYAYANPVAQGTPRVEKTVTCVEATP